MNDPIAQRWLKRSLGVAFVVGGGALVFWSVARFNFPMPSATQGVPLLSLIGVALGLAALGASADLLGLSPRSDSPPKIRNTKVYGCAEPASEEEAKATANGGIRAPMHDRTFSD